MTRGRLIAMFVMVGGLLPLAWLAGYRLVDDFHAWWYGAPKGIHDLRLALWPSSVLMLGDPSERTLILALISVALNCLLYALLGVLIWVGLARSRGVLIGTSIAVVAGVYLLLNL